MTAIEGRKGIALEMKAAHQHGVFAIAMHDAFAAWFHGAVVSVWLFEHLVVALIQADQVIVLNGKAQLRIKRRCSEAFRITEGVIPELDGAGGLSLPRGSSAVDRDAWDQRHRSVRAESILDGGVSSGRYLRKMWA